MVKYLNTNLNISTYLYTGLYISDHFKIVQFYKHEEKSE